MSDDDEDDEEEGRKKHEDEERPLSSFLHIPTIFIYYDS